VLRTFVAVLLGATIGTGRADAAPPAAAPCSAATYVVKGSALVGAGGHAGKDTVVLQIAGDGDNAPPAIVVGSGCPEAPVTFEPSASGTRLSARLTGCAGVDGDIAFYGRIDRTCTTMRGRLLLPSGSGRRRFTAIVNGGLAGRVIGRVSARHGDAAIFLPDMKVVLVKRGGRRVDKHKATTDPAGAFTTPGHPAGE